MSILFLSLVGSVKIVSQEVGFKDIGIVCSEKLSGREDSRGE